MSSDRCTICVCKSQVAELPSSADKARVLLRLKSPANCPRDRPDSRSIFSVLERQSRSFAVASYTLSFLCDPMVQMLLLPRKSEMPIY